MQYRRCCQLTESLWEEYEAFAQHELSGFEVVYLFADAVVRHEAPYHRAVWKGPPAACRSNSLKLEAA